MQTLMRSVGLTTPPNVSCDILQFPWLPLQQRDYNHQQRVVDCLAEERDPIKNEKVSFEPGTVRTTRPLCQIFNKHSQQTDLYYWDLQRDYLQNQPYWISLPKNGAENLYSFFEKRINKREITGF